MQRNGVERLELQLAAKRGLSAVAGSAEKWVGSRLRLPAVVLLQTVGQLVAAAVVAAAASAGSSKWQARAPAGCRSLALAGRGQHPAPCGALAASDLAGSEYQADQAGGVTPDLQSPAVLAHTGQRKTRWAVPSTWPIAHPPGCFTPARRPGGWCPPHSPAPPPGG